MSRVSGGFTLIENLAALAMLSIGLLGTAALLASALGMLRASTQRQAAVVLADDLASRIGAVDLAEDPSALPDLQRWRSDVASRLPNGVGSVTRSARGRIDIVTIDVRWDEPGDGPQRHRLDVAVER